MKFIRVAAAAAICAVSLGIFSTPAAARDQYFINSENVNLRCDASFESEIFESVSAGTIIFPIETDFVENEWIRSYYKGQLCYIHSKYISYGVPEENVIEEIPPTKKLKSLGKHKVTTYCSCSKCCGKGGGKITAAGTTPTVGRTIGCNWLPLGTHVIIEDHEYIVEDRGAKWVKGFDIYWGNDHHAALHSGFGRKIEVFMVEE